MSARGWVNLYLDPLLTVLEWGITYYAGGIARGTDLAPLFRFDPHVEPQVFPR